MSEKFAKNSPLAATLTDEDLLLDDQAKQMLKERYLRPGEKIVDMFARVAKTYSSNEAHEYRMFNYMIKKWFMPATPILSGTGAPISCFISEMSNDIHDFADTIKESAVLLSYGGGVAIYCDDIMERRIEHGVVVGDGNLISFHPNGVARIMETMHGLQTNKNVRNGTVAVYISIYHPNIMEFLDMRTPHGGDPSRKAMNIHHGICIDDKFMEAVIRNEDWILRADGIIPYKISAKYLLGMIIQRRISTGEPYIVFVDNINKNRPEHQKSLGLDVKLPNLCTEVVLPTGIDYAGKKRTATCCLGALNLEKFYEFCDDEIFIHDCMEFLDNVLEVFINQSIPATENAVYSSYMSRNVGLGESGIHSLFQKLNIPFDSKEAEDLNLKIAEHIYARVNKASAKLAEERGPCPDMKKLGLNLRFSYTRAVAPNVSVGVVLGVSPGGNPYNSNAYSHKTSYGNIAVKNPYLEKLLISKNMNNSSVWQEIVHNNGSVANLHGLSDFEKKLFQTGFEIDQFVITKLVADRQKFIDQAQSLEHWISPDVDPRHAVKVVAFAWKSGVKTLYYNRSRSVGQAAMNDCIACAS